jgi:diguanylate cyclase (GGDEF)-like protein
VCARLGGDEFVIVCENLGESESHQLALRVRDAIATPISLRQGVCTVDVSVGVAFALPADDVTTLLLRADAAAYRAKSVAPGLVELAYD